jgi:hypothetical protein
MHHCRSRTPFVQRLWQIKVRRLKPSPTPRFRSSGNFSSPDIQSEKISAAGSDGVFERQVNLVRKILGRVSRGMN